MKKATNPKTKLKIEKLKILSLTSEQMGNVAAGEDTSLVKPSSFDCIPPYNIAPYLTQKYCY
ncbi:MAG: hypothetical protein LBF27_14170 [Sphingobacterium sp.]|jgi:hypothetical protein|nr:hypothetical protein [Sphingobacterium sp.]